MPFARPTLANIVATIGPASDSPPTIAKLIEAGVSVFRLNFSHGTLEDHARRLAAIRAVADELGHPIGVLGDLQGPKIRIGAMPTGGMSFRAGEEILLVPEGGQGDAVPNALPQQYAPLAAEVLPGHRVLINDGAVRLLAIDRRPDDPPGALRCIVKVGGLVTSHKGINLPDSAISAAAITDRDWECVEWAVANGLDFLALSFVRRAEEVLELRRRLEGMCPADHAHDASGRGSRIPVIAKIEKPEALSNIDAICDAADGLMVARGDLGVEMDIAQVPIIQKRLIAKADEFGKPCIVATQMLESMIESASPTRAEVSDVANAILDGADAVMLSAETAAGKHPVLAVEMMRRAIEAAEAEASLREARASPAPRLVESGYRTAALAHGAFFTARDLGAELIVCWSQCGGTARYLSQTGTRIPIIAYSSDPREVRRMALLRAVTARHLPAPEVGAASLSWFNKAADADLLSRGWVCAGDPIVILAGMPLGTSGATSALAVHYIGDADSGFMRLG